MPRKKLTALFVERVKGTAERIEFCDTNQPGLALRVNGTSLYKYLHGGPPGDRTRDTLIKSQVLYH
jgi:hypothetical protein